MSPPRHNLRLEPDALGILVLGLTVLLSLLVSSALTAASRPTLRLRARAHSHSSGHRTSPSVSSS